jgi:hypothetical protein
MSVLNTSIIDNDSEIIYSEPLNSLNTFSNVFNDDFNNIMDKIDQDVINDEDRAKEWFKKECGFDWPEDIEYSIKNMHLILNDMLKSLDEKNSKIPLLFPPRRMQRSCRCIDISNSHYEYLVTNANEGYAGIIAPGGGMVNWYLCHRSNKYYFVYKSISDNLLDGHLTSIDEINSLREAGR